MTNLEVQDTQGLPAPPPGFSWWAIPTRRERYARQLTAILFWVYATSQTFFFDVDGYVIDHVPNGVAWFVRFKFLVLLVVIIALALAVSTKRILTWAIYVAFYPLTRILIGLGLVGVFVAKTNSWPVVFTAINLVLSLFTGIRFKLVVVFGFVVSAALILVASTNLARWSAVVGLLLIAAAIVARRFYTLLRPSGLLRIYTKIMAVLLNFGQKSLTVDAGVKHIPPSQMNEAQMNDWSSKLQQAVLFGSLCDFLACKFQEYRKSGLPIAYHLANFALIVVGLVVIFSFANLGLYKIDRNSFAITGAHGFFEFFYYSFSTLFQQRISEITPLTIPARSVWMIETVLAFVLLGLLLSVYWAVRKGMDDSAVDQATSELRQQASTMESFVRSEYSLSVDEAIAELERVKKGITAFTSFLRRASGRPEGPRGTSESN